MKDILYLYETNKRLMLEALAEREVKLHTLTSLGFKRSNQAEKAGFIVVCPYIEKVAPALWLHESDSDAYLDAQKRVKRKLAAKKAAATRKENVRWKKVMSHFPDADEETLAVIEKLRSQKLKVIKIDITRELDRIKKEKELTLKREQQKSVIMEYYKDADADTQFKITKILSKKTDMTLDDAIYHFKAENTINIIRNLSSDKVGADIINVTRASEPYILNVDAKVEVKSIFFHVKVNVSVNDNDIEASVKLNILNSINSLKKQWQHGVNIISKLATFTDEDLQEDIDEFARKYMVSVNKRSVLISETKTYVEFVKHCLRQVSRPVDCNVSFNIQKKVTSFRVAVKKEISHRRSFVYKIVEIDNDLLMKKTIAGEPYLSTKIHEIIDTIKETFTELDDAFHKYLNVFGHVFPVNKIDYNKAKKGKLTNQVDAKNISLTIKHCLDLVDQQEKKLQKIAKIWDEYGENWIVDQYHEARARKREIIIYAGGTNSGKTFNGLTHFKPDERCAYLAPLRLLALENMETISEQIGPCALKTGEEIITNGTELIESCTVEMFSVDEYYDTVFIDECQMAADPQRGSAWTRAILGANANTVVIATMPHYVKQIKEMLSTTNDNITVIELERKTQLKAIGHIKTKDIKANTAIIAFSRKNVLQTAAILRDYGHKCSIIYGSMPPEMRMHEARRFRNGETDIIVSTDAIAMGLNLPIETILFSAVRKYNGVSDVMLDTIMIKQIAGRAGRFGMFEEGYYGTAFNADPKFINKGMAKFIHSDQKPLVAPNLREYITLSNLFKTEDIDKLNDVYISAISIQKKFGMADLSEVVSKFRTADRSASHGSLSFTEKLTFAFCPISNAKTSFISDASKAMATNSQDKSCIEKYLRVANGKTPLLKLESKISILQAYLWLSNRLPEVFHEQAEAFMQYKELQSKALTMLIKESENMSRCPTCKKRMPHAWIHRECNSCHQEKYQNYYYDDYYY